ncbi:MAG: hypothetical protein C0407_06230 [Desulfobacca sp.]|nr:hypothetical protein [Desulfobacca sp.]
MKRKLILTLALLLGLSVFSTAEVINKLEIKEGTEIYACNMPETCPCDTLALKPEKCKCGVELIKTKATKVDDKIIYVDSRKRGFKRVGKYTCSCPETCNCLTNNTKIESQVTFN